MRTRMVLVAAALAGGLLLIPAVMEQAEAAQWRRFCRRGSLRWWHGWWSLRWRSPLEVDTSVVAVLVARWAAHGCRWAAARRS